MRGKKPPKPAILANFQVWGSYVPTPFPTKAKFGLRKWTYGVLYHAKFYRHVHNYIATMITPTPSLITAKFCIRQYTKRVRLSATFYLNRCISSPLGGIVTKFGRF